MNHCDVFSEPCCKDFLTGKLPSRLQPHYLNFDSEVLYFSGLMFIARIKQFLSTPKKGGAKVFMLSLEFYERRNI